MVRKEGLQPNFHLQRANQLKLNEEEEEKSGHTIEKKKTSNIIYKLNELSAF